jgi:hypothetical protein
MSVVPYPDASALCARCNKVRLAGGFGLEHAQPIETVGPVFARALQLFPISVRTVDAIHLAVSNLSVKKTACHLR